MFNTLRMSLKIDINYAINSFIYTLKKAPIFKDLFVDNSIYKNKVLKTFIRVLSLILSTLRIIVFKALYIFVIYIIAYYINKNNRLDTFIHIYFLLAILGIYINNKLLSTSTKKYFSIILFNMNAKKYLKSDLFLSTVPSLVVNFLVLLLITNIQVAITLSVLSLTCRIIGEAINIWFYKKYKSLIINNLVAYWIIILSILGLCLLPIIHINISYFAVLITTTIFVIISIIAYRYLNKVNDYKLIYKKLNTINKVMSNESERDYNRQSVVEVRNKDILINNDKLKNKKGYDLFNTIFFERHKEILLRSAKNFAYVLGLITIGCIIVIYCDHTSGKLINEYILTRLSWAVIIMYFINRGAILTQAMFYNCDHAMLTFNFYKEPKVILNLFKKRLITITKINLIPGLIMAIGVILVLFLSGGTTNIINYITIPVFIISLSIFFSVHYLVIYYLLQPYNKYMKIKSITYTIVISLTYIISYLLTKVVTSALIFSILGVLLTGLYVVIALFLVYKLAPLTFRIR